MTLDFVKVADKWQEKWKNSKAFEPDPKSSKEGYYMQTAYPYPSGAMHIGHGRTYTVPDAILRFKRMQGFNALYPMGWHVTGTPVIAQCEKVASRDKKTIDIMTRVFKIPESDLEMLTEPLSFVDYFVNKAATGYKAGMKKLGIGIDWRRELTTIDPHYSKFISWQYNILKEKGLIIQGKFPVRYCPHDKNAVGDHDLSEGEGVDIVEYMVYKFECNGIILPAATLRPETVFGVTNMWLNPEEEYVLVDVCGEDWVVSREASEKLKHQYSDSEVVVKSVFDVSSLFGKLCKNPITGKEVPLLPASFVKGGFATGVVMSVPAHAPLDFVALEDLKKDTATLEKFNIDQSLVSEIKPIALIKVDGYGEFPAVDVCRRLGISSQKDSKCEEATNEVYKKEFHTG
ncbi:MAG: class I tRNA ligase family protein, partial [Candidatus Diapherotrites archaeon]|nr:class I tRNA ligase family protein [Candidatus Diapherotrites archaeon]